jgi:hypothetical protein
VAQITGNGNGGPALTTGWQTFHVNFGTLAAGNHTLTIGGYNNKKTLSDESTQIRIDDVRAVGTILLEANFDVDENGFSYVDDVFLGTSQPGFASGVRIGAGGFSGGALQVNLGGINSATIVNMSGGWQQNFTLSAPTVVVLSFRYNLTQTPHYESDEVSQVLVSVDGTLYGQTPNTYVAQITGNGNGGPALTTGWQAFYANLGTLAAGNHTLTIGGYNNKKTLNDESTQIRIDNVLVSP